VDHLPTKDAFFAVSTRVRAGA